MARLACLSTAVFGLNVSARAGETITLQPGGLPQFVGCQVNGIGGNNISNAAFLQIPDALSENLELNVFGCSGNVVEDAYYQDAADAFPGPAGWYDLFTSGYVTNVTWSPGQGMVLYSYFGSPVAITLNGTPPDPVLPPTTYCGCGLWSLLSPQTTNATNSFQDVTGYVPQQGAQVSFSVPSGGGAFVASATYNNGAWTPSPPILTNSQAAFFYIPCQAMTGLFNTGVNDSGAPLANYTAGDPHYTLVSVPGGSSAIQVLDYGAWIGADSISAWIGPNNDSSDDGPTGQFDYRTTFVMLGDPTTAAITGQFSTDNEMVDIYLNGHSLGIASTFGYVSWTPFQIPASANFLYGTNTLDFIVNNDGGPTGLRVEMNGVALKDYCATAQPAQAVYPMGSQVPLTVQTFNCPSHAAVPNSSATVWISTRGFVRSLPALTGASGSTTVNFVPLPTEAGSYQVAATRPGESVPSPQGSFTLVGMSLSTGSISAQLTPGVALTNTIALSNLTSVDLDGITASVVGPTPDVQVQLNTSATLAGNSANQLIVVFTPLVTTIAQDQFEIQVTSAQGTTNVISATANVLPAVPQLVATPASLNAAMVQGGQTLVNFKVVNVGGAAAGPIQVLLPAAPWLSLVTPGSIPSMAPGATNQVTLALTPATNLTLGPYSGSIELASSNAQLAVPFQFDCVSTLTGSLLVTVQDELSISPDSAGNPNVSNATVVVSDFLTGTNLATNVTDVSGTVLFTNLTSAYYNVAVSAPDHSPFSTTLLLAANETNDLTAFVSLQLVDYTWLVTPTVVSDHYEFTLDTTFETLVPWPVVTISPGAIDLCTLEGQAIGQPIQTNLIITNSGLISAQGLNLYFGTHPDWSIQPLVTSLGDLLPQTNIVVPVTITRLGSATGVPDAITAQLSYHVAAINTNKFAIVPIYLFDANPADCEAVNPTPPPTNIVCVPCGGGPGPADTNSDVGGGGGFVYPPNYTFQPPQGALVQVKLQIDQNAVIARDAFHASLKLDNNAGATVSNLLVTITVYDASNNVAGNLFGIPAPVLHGLNAVDGTGVMSNGASGDATWTIVPATNAAPQMPTPFAVGGSFSYLLNGVSVTNRLFPVPITVLPTPILNVDYFLQHDVYSDDPFTPQIEPSIPFALGILVKNAGYGNALDFSITSAQPKIIENSNDLIIGFALIGSQAGSNQFLSPSLTLDLGNIGAQASAGGLWYMTSTLEGQFISFTASYQHVDDLGNTNTSIISSVHTHELNHVVRLTVPGDDGLPDFLVNDSTNVDALPNFVYSSDGSTNPVTSLSVSNTTTSGVLSGSGGSITVEANNPMPSGWVYLEVIDPGAGAYPIIGVQRNGGTNLLVGPNVWQTPERIHMEPPRLNNLIHIFDYNYTNQSLDQYTVTYGMPITPPSSATGAATDITPTSATLNADVTPNGADTDVYFRWGPDTNYGNVTLRETLTEAEGEDLYMQHSVAVGVDGLQEHTTYHYQVVAINNAGTNFGMDASFVTPSFPPPKITPVTNRSLIDGRSLVITNHAVAATLPLTWSLSGAPAGAAIDPNTGVFSWEPTCSEGSSTNQITVLATDSSSPPLSSSVMFTVTVSECVQVAVGSTVMQVGTTANIPVTLSSSVGITNLSFSLASPANRFTNWTFVSSNPSIATTNVQTAGSAPPLFILGAQPGQALQSNSLLGSIGFTALPGASAFVPVAASNIVGFKSDGGEVGNPAGLPGQIIVIGLQPLLQASQGTNPERLLTIYGNPGSNYQLSFSTNLFLNNWQAVGLPVLMTNLQQNLNVDQTAPQIYYQAR